MGGVEDLRGSSCAGRRLSDDDPRRSVPPIRGMWWGPTPSSSSKGDALLLPSSVEPSAPVAAECGRATAGSTADGGSASAALLRSASALPRNRSSVSNDASAVSSTTSAASPPATRCLWSDRRSVFPVVATCLGNPSKNARNSSRVMRPSTSIVSSRLRSARAMPASRTSASSSSFSSTPFPSRSTASKIAAMRAVRRRGRARGDGRLIRAVGELARAPSLASSSFASGEHDDDVGLVRVVVLSRCSTLVGLLPRTRRSNDASVASTSASPPKA
mmetsp:Transcript_16746/g.67567  ORF Transcript_16746/g.67567 Transcript_16746/m.67567 type:complete len:274 (+) Transcript_16746:111-932(+)